ncbi:MAG: redoxin domain-containing protein [Calditrichaceae bacterium]|nr:redoxin domain-containing protein [Calditrichaceae bacterium]
MNRNYTYFFFFLFSFILFYSCSSPRHSIDGGDTAPDFKAENTSGQSFSLADMKGKRILIHFWADWCSECRAEFPKLEEAYQKYKNDNFKIIAINVGQSKEHVESFVEEFKLTFPMLLDEQSEIARQYGIRGLPTNFFIDENRVVTKMIIGWVDEKQINQIINKRNAK